MAPVVRGDLFAAILAQPLFAQFIVPEYCYGERQQKRVESLFATTALVGLGGLLWLHRAAPALLRSAIGRG